MNCQHVCTEFRVIEFFVRSEQAIVGRLCQLDTPPYTSLITINAPWTGRTVRMHVLYIIAALATFRVKG